ncbi:hypothetical protein VZ95_03630 [Elstera litoralis]|uniref:Alginate lyase domain-containing protein n=1 Tax=Elstera litoralis TaxID=552518 RepID=A0A0F3IVH0_9PROT|nr:hypothetical protein VZ95_03630 [Elstera litoralis]
MHSPVDIAEAKALAPLYGPKTPEKACPPPPAPIRDIEARAFYSDASHSIEDPAIVQANRQSLRPLREYVNRIERLTESYLATGNRDNAACALTWLESWAAADALLGTMKERRQAGFERKWMLGALALPFSALKETPGVCTGNAACDRIGAWFKRIALDVQKDYGPAKRANPKNTSARNNHQNWAGATVMLAAVAADDAELFDWAKERFKDGLTEIQADGSLPLEVSRGQRAIHYHVFALTPMLMMAATLQRNASGLSEADIASLRRLANRVRDDLADPAYMAAKTGITQETVRTGDGKLRPDKIAWAEPWYRLTQDASVLPLLKDGRPITQTSLGGNWTLFFGQRLP